MRDPIIAAWRYRQFVLASIKGEFRNRFARSRLGAAWFVVHPLAQSAIFAIMLSEVLGARLPGAGNKAAYPIYLLSGMAAWHLFSEILNRSLTVFIDNASALKKIAFPRVCLPLIIWGSALVNHALLLGAMTVVCLAFGHYPSPAWLALPIGILLISMFAFGLGVIAGIFNVFSRDVAQVFGVLLQLWFWMTPVVYPVESIPLEYRWLVNMNPLYPLVRIYQDALLYHRWPDLSLLLPPALMVAALVAASFAVFRRASPELVDAL